MFKNVKRDGGDITVIVVGHAHICDTEVSGKRLGSRLFDSKDIQEVEVHNFYPPGTTAHTEVNIGISAFKKKHGITTTNEYQAEDQEVRNEISNDDNPMAAKAKFATIISNPGKASNSPPPIEGVAVSSSSSKIIEQPTQHTNQDTKETKKGGIDF